MLLAVDVGNSSIAFGVFDGDRLVVTWRLRTDPKMVAGDYGIALRRLAEKDSVDLSGIDAVSIASVVPEVVPELVEFARESLGVREPYCLMAAQDFGVEINYRPKSALGTDRVANALAAHELYSGAVIVVDMGTAITFDAVAENGDFLGGAIAPGIMVSMDALATRAAQLGKVPLIAPPKSIGRTTEENMQSGLIYGFAGQVDGIVDRMKEEMGEAFVVATGGLAEVISPHCRSIQEVNPTLTLQGIRVAYERVRNKG